MPNLSQHEKTDKDIKKGVVSKEPDDMLRLEEEDLLKINLDETIVGLTDDEDDVDHYEHSSNESEQEGVMEEFKTNIDYIDIKDLGNDIMHF